MTKIGASAATGVTFPGNQGTLARRGLFAQRRRGGVNTFLELSRKINTKCWKENRRWRPKAEVGRNFQE